MQINTTQQRYLRGLTHHINPVVMVGEKGLTENVLAEIEQALDHHELVKIKLRVDRESRKSMIAEIERRCGAMLVHRIGQVACFFRRNAKRPVIDLPHD